MNRSLTKEREEIRERGKHNGNRGTSTGLLLCCFLFTALLLLIPLPSCGADPQLTPWPAVEGRSGEAGPGLPQCFVTLLAASGPLWPRLPPGGPTVAPALTSSAPPTTCLDGKSFQLWCHCTSLRVAVPRHSLWQGLCPVLRVCLVSSGWGRGSW